MKSEDAQLKLRIDWGDLDLFGHVNNVVFYRYMQSARVQFWQQIGIYEWYSEKTIAPMLVSASTDFKKPLYYPGNAVIKYHPAFIRNTSFGLEYRIMNDEGELAAEGRDAMVLYDFNNRCKLNFPDDLRAEVMRLMPS